MAVKITNLTRLFQWVPLTSGDTLRLSPGKSSGAIPNVEVRNHRIDQLVRERAIAVEAVDKVATKPSAAHRPKPAEGHDANSGLRSRRKASRAG